MRYPPKHFRDGLPEWKRRKDPILSRLVYRPVSFYLSSLFCQIGMSANMVSYLSAVVALVACGCFVLGWPLAGAALINVWLFLDCADGNIARCVRKERYGDFADSMSSYVCVGLMFACMGYSAYFSGGVVFGPGDPRVILVGALAGSCDSLMRLLYQKYLNSSREQGVAVSRSEDPERESGVNRVRMKVDQYVSLGGFLPVAVLLSVVFGFLDLVVVLWAVYYALVFAGSSAYLVRETLRANSADPGAGVEGLDAESGDED